MARSRARIAQLLSLSLALSAAAFAVPGSPARPEAATAAGCSVIRDRTVHIDATEKTSTRWVKITRSNQVEYTRWKTIRGPVDLGRMSLTMEMCKSAGKWSIREVDVSQPHNDLELTVRGDEVTKIEPADGDEGYAIIYRRTTGSAVQLVVNRCTPKPKKFSQAARDVLKGVTALPLPGKYIWSVGAYAVNVALPSAPEQKYYCGQMGSEVTIKLKVRKGKPRLVWPSSGHEIRYVRDQWEQPCGGEVYRYCAEMFDQVVIVKKAA
jgi:hypothetical protein